MADEDDPDEDLEGSLDEGGDEPSSSEGGRKKLIIAGAVLLAIIGGVATAYFTDALDPVIAMFSGQESEEVSEEGMGMAEAGFLDLDGILVDLNTGERNRTYLKIQVSLEVADPSEMKSINAMMPRIIDSFQVYLRELRIEDLKGSAGMYRLKEELLLRVNAAIAPMKVDDVLFKEMLVQ